MEMKPIMVELVQRAALTSPQRRWRTPRLPELAGYTEATEILGVSKMTLGRWQEPGSGPLGPENTYMIPAKRIASGPVWVREDLVRFSVEVGRQRAPIGEAKGRQRSNDDLEAIREQIKKLEQKLADAEAKEDESTGGTG